MGKESQSVERPRQRLRDFLLVVGSLIIAGLLGAEFLPMIVHTLSRVEENVDHHPIRRLFRQHTKTNQE